VSLSSEIESFEAVDRIRLRDSSSSVSSSLRESDRFLFIST
jgi:hypothetical protein